MQTTKKPSWTSFENATKDDFLAVMEYDEAFNDALPDRLLEAIRALDEEWTAYPINRYQHSLQAATRAHAAGEDEETVIAALIHDIGDSLAPFNHGELAAAVVKPYVSEKSNRSIATAIQAAFSSLATGFQFQGSNSSMRLIL